MIYNKKFRQKYGPSIPGNSGSFLALLKHAFILRYLHKKNPKESVYLDTSWKTEVPTHIPQKKFNYLAIVYDDVVQEMIRVDDTTAKFLLGGAELVHYDPEITLVKKEMKYTHGHFIPLPDEDTDAAPLKED